MATTGSAARLSIGSGWAWLGWSLAYLLLQTLTPFVRVPIGWVWIGTLLSTLALMASMLGLVFSLARMCEARRWLVFVLLGGGATALVLWFFLPAWWGVSPSRPLPLALAVFYRAFHGYLLILTAIGLGSLLSRLIRDRNLLVPVAPFAALVDAITVLTPMGFVKQMVEKAPAVVERAAVAVMTAPAAAPTVERVVPIVLMGVGDFVFLTLYAACLYRFGLRTGATAIALFFVLWAYLVVVMLGVAAALPALVPMAVVVLAVNWREFRLSRQELLASLLVVGGTAALLLWLLLR
ncbi:MAG: hypothetical protein ABDI19_02880 [Armatimonadota bacterium]